MCYDYNSICKHIKELEKGLQEYDKVRLWQGRSHTDILQLLHADFVMRQTLSRLFLDELKLKYDYDPFMKLTYMRSYPIRQTNLLYRIIDEMNSDEYLPLIHTTCKAQNIQLDINFTRLDYSFCVRESNVPIINKGQRERKINQLETFYNLLKAIGIESITADLPFNLKNFTKLLYQHEVLLPNYELVELILSQLCHQYFGVYYFRFVKKTN